MTPRLKDTAPCPFLAINHEYGGKRRPKTMIVVTLGEKVDTWQRYEEFCEAVYDDKRPYEFDIGNI